MIELLVSIAVFAIITAIVLIGFVSSRKYNDLRLAADGLENNLRRMQSSAIAGQEINGAVPKGFGVSFDFLTAGGNSRYTLFADTESYSNTGCVTTQQNQRNDRILGGPCADTTNKDPEFSDSPIQLPSGVVIDTVYIGAVAIGSSATYRRADIVFKTPEGTVHAHYGHSFASYIPGTGTYLPSDPINQVTSICLKQTQTNQYRKITLIGATGQVDVGNLSSTCSP